MGFYAPAQIVRDAREHGVEVRPVDVNASDWDCTLEVAAAAAVAAVAAPPAGEETRLAPVGDVPTSSLALRLGFRQVKGLKAAELTQLVEGRGGGYRDLADLRRRSGVSAATLDRLARADAFTSLALDRRGALWKALGLERTGHERDLPPLFAWARDREAVKNDRKVATTAGQTAPVRDPRRTPRRT